MPNPSLQSVENYYQRLQFPGGIHYYPLGFLKDLKPLRAVHPKGKAITFNGKKNILYESNREKREIFRVLKILGAMDVKTQVIKIVTPSGKDYYPDIIAQLGDGSIIIIEVKHLLDFLWKDVIEKYESLLTYCVDHGYGTALMDGNWRDFEYVRIGNTIHFQQVIRWFDEVIKRKGEFTLKDLRANFPEEKYWATLVSYCLKQGFYTDCSFRNPLWAIRPHRLK